MALLPARPVDLRAQGEGVVEYPGKVACPSGRRCSTRNAVWCHSHPGFKSQRYRHCRPAPLGPGGFVMPSWRAVWLCGPTGVPGAGGLGCGAGLLCVPVGGGPPASRPRCELRSASSRSPARPRRRPSISHVIPLRLVQTLNLHRWNCNVFGVSRKMTAGNYVRLLVSVGSAAAFGCWGRTLRPFMRSSSLRRWGFCTTRSLLAACRRRVEPSCSAIPPDWCRRQPRVSRLGPADQAARLSETPVAFAGAGRASTETVIAFAGEKWAFLERFSVAVVLLVSTVAFQGRAVVMGVSCWPASVAAEVSLVSKSPRAGSCARKSSPCLV